MAFFLKLADDTSCSDTSAMEKTVFSIDCWFDGHVQGVGFRYTAVALAKGYEVTGSVRNLSDGRVYLRAEGEESEVRDFHLALSAEMEDYIRETEVKTESGPRTREGFKILD